MIRSRDTARHFVRFSAVAGICLLAAAADVPADAFPHHYLRHYQATAYISLFSVNIFSRTGVGFGYAKAEESGTKQRRDINLQFLSGSIPARARGLNRFGFIEENIKERDGVCAEADYLGLMTANGEESLSQAKAALETKSDVTPFVAARAKIDSESASYSVRHIKLSSAYRGADAKELLEQVRASFERPETGQTEHRQELNGEALGTFLYSVREAMTAGSGKLEKRFLYNGKMFRLLADEQQDAKVGQELHTAGLVEAASSTVRLNGVIRNEKTNEMTNFRLWFDRTTPDLLPLRFEFRPKPYLRLVFQASAGPSQKP